jgi:Undecaprenyl-phosphate glucose phosphotransferase
MSQAALKLDCADLEQSGASAPTPEQLEAEKLADLAASFCLFGLRIAVDWPPAAAEASAEEGYRAEAPAAAPANDAAPTHAFPDLPKRGAHIPATAPMRLIQALDWVFVLLAAEFAALWGAGAGLLGLSLGQAGAFVAAAMSLKAGLWLTESYRVSPGRISAERGIGGLALGVILGLGVAAFIAPDARAAAAISATLPVAAMLLAGVHAALAIWIRAAHKKGVFAETIVLIGATEAAARLAQRAAKSGDARIIAVVDDRLSRSPHRVAGAPVGGDLEALLAWEGLPNVDRIVITVTQKAEARVRAMIERLRVTPNRVDLLLDYDVQSVRGRGVDRVGGAAVACVSGRPNNPLRAAIKRAEDIVISAALLALFALPMLVIAALVKLDSKGPVFYRQRRHGFNNRPITILKFRSMQYAPHDAFAQVVAGDPRVTRIGRFLRRTSLDELPQLWNVLRGEMSLVGPRPHAIGMKAADRELSHIVAEYAHRHRVKPGLTGWAQVNGSRGPVNTAAELRKRVRYDLEYVARSSLWLDLIILARTAPVLFGDNKAQR